MIHKMDFLKFCNKIKKEMQNLLKVSLQELEEKLKNQITY